MARGHAKLADRVDGPGHDFKGRRNAGGQLHQRGKGRKPKVASPIVSQATVVHQEKQETALEVKIVAGLTRANAMIEKQRVQVADRELARARQAREDICNIVHVPTSLAAKEAHVAALFARYG